MPPESVVNSTRIRRPVRTHRVCERAVFPSIVHPAVLLYLLVPVRFLNRLLFASVSLRVWHQISARACLHRKRPTFPLYNEPHSEDTGKSITTQTSPHPVCSIGCIGSRGCDSHQH